MAGGATTLQFRLVLSAVDRGVDLSTKLVVPRREDETMTHVVLRVLAFCLYYRAEQPEGGELRLAPGPADRDGPDLWAHDFGGRPTEWIICGAPDVEELRYVFQHQRQAKIRILVSSSEERDRFLGALRAFRRTLPGLAGVDLRQVDETLLQTLGARRRGAAAMDGDGGGRARVRRRRWRDGRRRGRSDRDPGRRGDAGVIATLALALTAAVVVGGLGGGSPSRSRRRRQPPACSRRPRAAVAAALTDERGDGGHLGGVVAFGELHQTVATAKIPSALHRFTDELLPALAAAPVAPGDRDLGDDRPLRGGGTGRHRRRGADHPASRHDRERD